MPALATKQTLLRYVLQGLVLNLLGIVIFAGLVWLLPDAVPLLLNALTSLLLFPISFAANRVWVFNSRGAMAPQIRRFVVVYGSAAAASFILYAVIWSLFPVGAIFVQAVVVGLIVVGSFVLNLTWTFARADESAAPDSS